ncbi:DUF6603 domain-containing protein [Marivirga lumbricoides]
MGTKKLWDSLSEINNVKALSGAVLGTLHALELGHALQTSPRNFQFETPKEVNENCYRIEGCFPKLFGLENIKGTFWVFDVISTNGNKTPQRHFILQLNFSKKLEYLFSALSGIDNFADQIGNDEASSSLSPVQDQSISGLYYSSGDFSTAEIKERCGAEVPFGLPIGLSCRIQANLGQFSISPGFQIPSKSEIGVTLNLQPRAGAYFFQFIIELKELFHETERKHGEGELQLKPEQLSFGFNFREKQLSLAHIGLNGHIKTPFDSERDVAFSGRLNWEHKRLSLNVSDLPDIEHILAQFLPEDDPILMEMHKSGSGSIGIDHLAMEMEFSPAVAIRHAEIVISARQPIQFLEKTPPAEEGLIQLQPRVALAVTSPFSKNQKIDFTISGWAQMAGTRLDAMYNSSEQALLLDLSTGHGVQSDGFHKLLPALKDCFPKEGEESPVISIAEMSLMVQKRENWTVQFILELDSSLSFEVAGHTFSMSHLDLQFAYQNNHIENLDMSGRFHLGAVDLTMSASYTHDWGWSLMAQTAPFSLGISDVIPYFKIDHLTKAGHDEAKKLADSFNLDLIIERVYANIIIPRGEAKEEGRKNELSLLLHVQSGENVSVPFDFFFLELYWQETLQWEAIIHFTLRPAFTNELGKEIPAINLQLDSKREIINDSNTQEKKMALSFHGSMEHLPIDELLLFFEDRFGIDPNDQLNLPASLKDITLEKIEVSLTKTATDWKFTFECDTKIITEQATKEHEEKSIATQLIFTVEKHINAESKENEYQVDLAGHLFIPITANKTLNFGLHFHHDPEKDWLLASYQGEVDIPVSQLLESWLHSETKWPELSLKISNACIFIQSKKNAGEENAEEKKRERSVYFGVEMASSIQLKEMPFLKTLLTDDLTAGIEQFRVAYTSSDIDKNTLTHLSKEFKVSLKEAGIYDLPVPQSEKGGMEALGKGFHLSGKLKLGKDYDKLFSVGPEVEEESSHNKQANETVEESNKQLRAATPSLSSSEESSLVGKWFKVGKTLGPLTISRLGIQYDYQKQDLWILLDAGLEMAILEVSVDGLGIGSPLSNFKPKLRLSGLGVDFHKDPLEIGGALIFQEPTGKLSDATTFSGMLTLQFKALGLSVFGSYTDALGEPSFLVYGVLDYPIGGPPFFLVEGLAAGVGINRRVQYPSIDELNRFSLIDAVISSENKLLTDRISRMEKDLKAELGSYFFAAGVKFSTFKLLNSFVLLILGIGEHTELDLLGYSLLTAPLPLDDSGEEKTKIDPIAQARLLVHAAFRPDAGTLQVEARLDAENSFLVSRNCKLQGGFAFYAWFKEEDVKNGDFVLTLGGYHAQFNVPSHYPQVPRLGFHWQVDPHMLFKGELYFALTPNALMAGGLLEGNWKKDHFEASFRLALNLLMQWQPFHYEGDFSLSIKVAYSDDFLQIELELTTEIAIWGPEFGGIAHLKLLILEIDVDFGAPKVEKIEKLGWKDFAKAFLSPVSETGTIPDAFSCRVSRGLIAGAAEGSKNLLGTVDPSALEIFLESTVPISNVEINGEKSKANKEISIAPMNRQNVNSTLHLTVKHEGEKINDFEFDPVLKNAPAALWGKQLKPELNSSTTIENCLFGYRIAVKPELFHQDNNSIQFPTTDLEALLIEPNVSSKVLDPLEWHPLNEEVLLKLYSNTASSSILSAFGIQPTLKKERKVFQPIQLLRPFNIPTQ